MKLLRSQRDDIEAPVGFRSGHTEPEVWFGNRYVEYIVRGSPLALLRVAAPTPFGGFPDVSPIAY